MHPLSVLLIVGVLVFGGFCLGCLIQWEKMRKGKQ